jgi:hypothetical protein
MPPPPLPVTILLRSAGVGFLGSLLSGVGRPEIIGGPASFCCLGSVLRRSAGVGFVRSILVEGLPPIRGAAFLGSFNVGLFDHIGLPFCGLAFLSGAYFWFSVPGSMPSLRGRLIAIASYFLEELVRSTSFLKSCASALGARLYWGSSHKLRPCPA